MGYKSLLRYQKQHTLLIDPFSTLLAGIANPQVHIIAFASNESGHHDDFV
jgi:hypothetical protein